MQIINQNCREEWDALFYRSKCVDVELTPIKRKFTVITQKEIGGFKEEMADFVSKFENEGPCTVGDNLDTGLALMNEYKKLIATHDKNSAELSNAEKLFGLEVTAYPKPGL